MAASYKRKRSPSSASAFVLGPYRPPRPLKRRKAFVPGRDRIGGYYGRYAGAGRPGELKFHDVDIDDAIIGAGGTIENGGTINIIPQGVTENQRIGRKCTIRSIHWRYRLRLPELDAVATPGPADVIRIILYMDKQCNGATAVNTDIVEANDVNTFRNLANSGRFIILMDRTHVLNYATLASDGAGLVSGNSILRQYVFNKKCMSPLEFDSTTGALTEIRSNNFGVLVIGQSRVASINGKFRLRFSDN